MNTSIPGVVRTSVSALALGVLLAAPAFASSVGPWTLSGPGSTSVTESGNSVIFDYALNPAGFSEVTWTASALVTEGGQYSFDWLYEGFHAFFNVTAFLNTTNPVMTLVEDGPENCCTEPSSGFSYSGFNSIAVTAGDTIGFTFGGSNFDSNNQLNGTLTVSQVPLPPALGMLLAAVGFLGLRARKSNSA